MLRKMKINKYFLGIVLIIIIIMYFMAGVLFLGNTREDNNMKVSTEQQEIAYQTFKSETEGYSLASKYAENRGIIRMCEQVAASGNTLILYSA